MTTAPSWREIADGVHVWRQPRLDVNAVLVVGQAGALVVDTLSTAGQAAELAAAARRITALPWQLVNTHAHFDHCFGNATLAGPGTPIWAHPGCAELLGRPDVAAVTAAAYAGSDPAFAAELGAVTVRAPDGPVHDRVTLDLGGRTVDLRFLGRGHTDADVVVVVPDAGVVCAGDLLEEGAPPSFEESRPLEWPATVAALRDHVAGPVVPGHGAVVDAAFVAAQHADLARLEWLCRGGHADGAPAEEVAAASPFGARASLPAVRRAYAGLDGAL